MPLILFVLMSLSAFAENSRDGLLKLKHDFCVCRDGETVSYGLCASFCANKKTDGAEILFASFDVAENRRYKTVHEWCTKKSQWDFRNHKCLMSFKDEEGRVAHVDVKVQDNTVMAEVTNLAYDKVVVFNLKETVSRSVSDALQVIKLSTTNYPLPVRTGFLSQFTCVSKSDSKRYHFYFATHKVPSAQGAGSDFICHNWMQYGHQDDENFPRLEEIRQALTAWPATGPLFYDNDGNGNMDVNDAILKRTKILGGSIPTKSNFFHYFNLPGSDGLYARSGSNKNSDVYTMAIWVDQATFQSYCLNETHYNSRNPLFRAIGDVVALPTEGLYAGVQTGDKMDVILLREADVKSVWFYMKDNHPSMPNDQNVSAVTVYFYYPLDKADPYTRKSYQKLYKVTGSNELSLSLNSSIPAHDRKIACIPKM